MKDGQRVTAEEIMVGKWVELRFFNPELGWSTAPGKTITVKDGKVEFLVCGHHSFMGKPGATVSCTLQEIRAENISVYVIDPKELEAALKKERARVKKEQESLEAYAKLIET